MSISADGSTFVVGAPFNGGNGIDSGHVRVYKYSSTFTSYAQVGLDINGEAAGDWFGNSVGIAADGTTFVVGARYNDGNGVDSGHVRVFKYSSTVNSYSQVGMDINGEAAGDQFGWSVSISADGSTFVVGAPFNDGNGDSSGHVRVYKYNSTVASYSQLGLDINGEAALDYFGSSVSISADGSTFVVGALRNDGNGFDSGHVRVYKYNSTLKTYSQVGLDIDGEAANDIFGSSVSISADGTTFIAGAYLNDGNGDRSGHVRVYKYSSAVARYSQVGLDINGEASGDQFGFSVSISADGNAFIVGGNLNDGNGGNSGHVRVYKYNSTVNGYAQFGQDINGEAVSDWFGYSVSISADGATVGVGTPYNDGSGSNSGHVRVYREAIPTNAPTNRPTRIPSKKPTMAPTKSPTKAPTKQPTKVPTKAPTNQPTKVPTKQPIKAPTKQPAKVFTKTPSKAPRVTISPTATPTAPPENCGLLGWNLFCPRRGKCGLIKRLLNIGNCD